MNWFKNLFKKEPEMITVYSYRAIFKTVDGEIHYSYFKYLDISCLTYDGPTYIMLGKKYLTDENGVMYPLQNIISIKWEINDAKEVEAEYMRGTHFKEIFYD